MVDTLVMLIIDYLNNNKNNKYINIKYLSGNHYYFHQIIGNK